MRLCFPVQQYEGIQSWIYKHFGSAPAFVLADSDTEDVTVMNNPDQHHVHGKCNPIETLAGQHVDFVIVGGIGGGALMKLNMAGIDVFQAGADTVEENIHLFNSGQLSRFQPGHAFSGHSQARSH